MDKMLKGLANLTSSRSEGRTFDNKTRKERNDFDTKYDSTWEDSGDIDESEAVTMQWSFNAVRNEQAAEDMQNFRHMLKKVSKKQTSIFNISLQLSKELPNLQFYQNKRRSEPDGVLIEEFHGWFGDYKRLENTHSFIQWLFPIQEHGMNRDSYILTAEEIKIFCQNNVVKERLIMSYRIMLDFYGIDLLDEKTGEVARAINWRERFENLDRNSHNNLRITRILKCLGILGFQHYQPPLVKFFLRQTLVKRELPNVRQSALDYFLFSVVDKKQRQNLVKYAFQNFWPREEFVWCPKKIQRRLLNQSAKNNGPHCSEPTSATGHPEFI